MTQNTPNPADTSLAYIAKLEAETQRLTQERDRAFEGRKNAFALLDQEVGHRQAAELQLSRLKAEVERAGVEIEAARSLMMSSGWWTNAAGYMTDAALWIDHAADRLKLKEAG